MSKYRDLEILKKTKAIKGHICYNCGSEITVGSYYYKQFLDDKFLQSLHDKKFCNDCFNKYGAVLFKLKNKKIKKDKYNNDEPSLFN